MTTERRPSRMAPAVAGALIVAIVAMVAVNASAESAVPAAQPQPAAPVQPATQPNAQPQSAAQPQPASPAPSGAPVDPGIAPFTWLEGCWKGEVNQREFREFWMPARGNVMVGVGQLSLNGTMQDYEYLRLEAKDGVVFSQFSGQGKVYAFKLASTKTDEKDTVFTFDHTENTFPEHLIYRRGVEGWLYETVEGPLEGTSRKVIYPLRRVSCETGELITK